MKKIFILSCYILTEKQLKILSDCIDILKQTDFKILLSSHKSIPIDIQDKVDYFIYDKDNSFLPKEISPYYFDYNSNFDIKIDFPGHALCVTRNLFNTINFANNYKFDFFYCMDFDCLLSSNDLNIIQDLVNQMFNNNKKMIFFKTSEAIRDEGYIITYDLLLFGGIASYFLNKFTPPTNLNEWLKLNVRNSILEDVVFDKFKKDEEEYLIINSGVSDYFKDSKINLSRYNSFICEIIYNETNPSNPILFIENFYSNKTNKKILIKENNIIVESREIHIGTWYYKEYILNGDINIVEVEIFDKNTPYGELTEAVKKFIINEENLLKFKDRGTIRFK